MKTMYTLKQERAIGYNVARLMEEKEITDEELAEMLSCLPVHVKEILTGSTSLEQEEVDEIAHLLDVPREELENEPEGVLDYNVHCMGNTSKREEMHKLLDKVDLYVRLQNKRE